jgi:hypothetical protein
MAPIASASLKASVFRKEAAPNRERVFCSAHGFEIYHRSVRVPVIPITGYPGIDGGNIKVIVCHYNISRNASSPNHGLHPSEFHLSIQGIAGAECFNSFSW